MGSDILESEVVIYGKQLNPFISFGIALFWPTAFLRFLFVGFAESHFVTSACPRDTVVSLLYLAAYRRDGDVFFISFPLGTPR
jgi:hypothetical protein